MEWPAFTVRIHKRILELTQEPTCEGQILVVLDLSAGEEVFQASSTM